MSEGGGILVTTKDKKAFGFGKCAAKILKLGLIQVAKTSRVVGDAYSRRGVGDNGMCSVSRKYCGKFDQLLPPYPVLSPTRSAGSLAPLLQYLGIVFAFSLVYMAISTTLPCSLELDTLREAYLFSLETMTTVGYGTNDYLFGHCWIMLPVLSLQACIGLLIDAFLIGILFARLSRPQTRASTVVFSKHAVIRRVRGEAYFM